ncbi:ribonuclease P protein component [Tropheryma whipplei]|uniref:ribonuclease P protein component n=1 Tax=Tropheryma whipplei TaxID=2039 RepID=UPI000000C945|nr:ribonuclease P protein component [Tropheryma whipplei]CAD67476.1 ribonuclease P protein component [Tropheryma whipplei TW08/27]
MICNLSGKKNFSRVFRQGRKINCEVMTVYVLFSEEKKLFVGFVIPKKIGCAVVRNRIRRRIRSLAVELFRRQPERLMGASLIFRVFPKSRPIGFRELCKDFEKVKKRMGIDA